MKPFPKDKTFHYTNKEMVDFLMPFLPLSKDDTVLDAGSGKNKVWFNALSVRLKFECELDDGCNFFDCDCRFDWIIGNPPFHISWLFTKHAMSIAKKGVAFLVNNTGLNSQMTPRRLSKMKEMGFSLNRIVVVSDKRWFGRYYFLVYTKKPSDFVSWSEKTF